MDNEVVNLRDLWLIVRRWLWQIAVCTLLGAGSAFGGSFLVTPVYDASTTLLVHQAPSGGTTEYTALLASERLARTYSEMLTGRPVLQQVIDELDLSGTLDELSKRVEVELVRDTQLIRLGVEDTDPVQAAATADAIADAFIEQNQVLQEARYVDSLASMEQELAGLSTLIEEAEAAVRDLDAPETDRERDELARLETTLAGYRNTRATLLESYEGMRITAAQSADDVTVFEPAQVPREPIRPRPLVNAALGGVMGAALALAGAFLFEHMDDTIRTPADAEAATALGTLGAIGRFPDGNDLVAVAEPLSPGAEAFRVLWANVRFSGVDRPLRTLLVTSPGPSEGKSATTANLAATMAHAGLRVVLVDGDLRRPRLHRLFDLHPRGGLTASLVEGSMDGRLQPVGQVEGLRLLPSGDRPPNPAELLGSQRMRELLGELAGEADVVLIDSPPVLPVADVMMLARAVDGVLLVLDVGETRREAAQQAVESLRQVGGNPIGVVLNRVPARGGGRYYYQYYRYDGNGKKRDRGESGKVGRPKAARKAGRVEKGG